MGTLVYLVVSRYCEVVSLNPGTGYYRDNFHITLLLKKTKVHNKRGRYFLQKIHGDFQFLIFSGLPGPLYSNSAQNFACKRRTIYSRKTISTRSSSNRRQLQQDDHQRRTQRLPKSPYRCHHRKYIGRLSSRLERRLFFRNESTFRQYFGFPLSHPSYV